MTTSANERVNCSSFFLFFGHGGEILMELEKHGYTTWQSHCLLILGNKNNVSSKDFHDIMWFMMIYQDLSFFLVFMNNATLYSKLFLAQ